MIRIFRFLLPLLILAGAAWGHVEIRSGTADHARVAPRTSVPLVSADPVRFVRAVPNVRLYGTVESPESGILVSAIEADVETRFLPAVRWRRGWSG